MKKRLLTSIIAICMLVSLLPTTALATGGTPCTTTGCTHVAAISNTHYNSLDDAVADVQPGNTIKLLSNITLADDAQIRIVNKGTAENPITLDFNGKTITGNNSNTDKPNKATAKSGILFLDGCYINLVDTSTTGTKGGVVNNTIASSGMVSALVVISYSATGSNVTINDGLRFEADKGASTKGIYHYRGNNAEIHLTINDAYVSSGGYVLDYTKLNGSGEVTINGGTFVSKKGNNLSPLYGSATLKINGGTFHNWDTDIDKVTDGHTISMAESDGKYIYTVISEENAPTEYIASMQTSSGKTVYMTEGSELYAFGNIQSLSKQTIHVAKDAAINVPVKFAIGNTTSGDTQGNMLTLELEDGVALTGSVPLNSADVIVTGNGDTTGFSCVPADPAKYEMTSNGENGMYSCRMKVDGGGATLVKTDGTRIGYATASGAITAAKGDPGSVVVLNKDASSTSTIKLDASADITLDLNGYKYTFTGTKKDGFDLTNGAKLTIINSNESKTATFIATGKSGTKANAAILTKNPGGGTIEIGENVTVKGPLVLLGEGSEVTVSGTVDATGLQEFAISGNGTAGQGNTKITIKDTAVVKSDSNCPAIYHPQAGTLTVEGGSIEGGVGIQMCAGTLNITGNPTITATGTHAPEAGKASGSIPDGAAISVVNRDYPGGIPNVNVTITGTPNVKAASGVDAVQAYKYSYTTVPVIEEWADVSDYVSISGGYYTSNVKDYVAEGYTVIPSDKSGYTYMVGEKSESAVEGVEPAVGAPDVDMTKIPQNEQDTVKGVAESVKADSGALAAAANKAVENVTVQQKIAAEKALGESKDVTVTDGAQIHTYVQVYLDITPTAYDEDNKIVTMDIVPKSRVVASTSEDANDLKIVGEIKTGETANAVVLKGSETKVDSIVTIPITVELPTGFNKETDKTYYAKHTHGSNTYYYPLTITEAGGKKTATFTNTHGFSLFELPVTLEPAASITVNGETTVYETLQDAVNAVQDGQTIKVLKEGQTATVSRTVKFTVENKKDDNSTYNYTMNMGSNCTDKDETENVFDVVYSKPSSGGGGVTTYAITTNSPANGTVTASPKNAAKGATVTLAVAPAEGYQLDKLTVVDKDGKEIALADKGDGKYTFTMPASKVDVTATFKEAPATHVCPSEKYTDVDTTQWYHEGVDYVIANGMMNGTGTNTFEPNSTTTRGMIVTILYRLEKEPAAGTSPFTDVDAGQWYAKAVAWAAANGVVNGTSPTTFNPNDPITREQMAAILYRYASFKGYDVTQKADLAGFTDVAQISDYAKDPMAWANKEGLIGGVSATTLQPQGSATRAQVATILMRFCENVAK